MTLLDEHVKRFNAAVRSGLRADARELRRRRNDGVRGRSRRAVRREGRDRQAYRERPPDDELDVLDVREDGDAVVAGYAWRREPDVRAGELRLTVGSGRIVRLVVTFEPSAPLHE